MADLPPILPTAGGRRRHGNRPFDSCVLAASSIYYAKPPSPFSSSSSSASNILRDVSLTARPGELLAVVGPSGAGKSTLLDILAGRTSPSSGHVLLNSSRLRPSCIRRLFAHLPQHDQCHVPHLTVSESFHLTARLVASSSDPSSLLSDLRLTHLADSLIPGSLSGGELRRVSLGLALLRRPAVLILDEPTSGLDSSSALLVLHSLRELTASSHRRPPVVLSIHQPSSLLLSSIDSFLLLSQGVVLHHGDLPSLSSFLASHGLPRSPDLNPLELALQFLPLLVPPTADGATRSPAPALATCLLSYPSPRVREISVLHVRSWKTIRRSRRLLLANALEAVLVGLLLGTLYVGAGRDAARGVEKRLGFFAFTLTFLLSSTTEALPTFITERPAILREASAGIYRLSSHLVASTLVFVPCLFVVALLYSSAVYFLVSLCPAWTAFAGFVAVIWALALAANSFVLFVSAVAPDYIAGTSVVTVALAAFFLFSGYFIRKERMPRYWLFMHYLSPYRYALDAMLENEYGCGARQCLAWEAGGTACRLTGRDVLAERGLTAGSKWVGFQVLLAFFVLYRVLYLLVLMRRVARCKR